MRFNGSKSVAMRVGNRYNENCAALQLAGNDIVYVSELKYLGIHVSAAELVQSVAGTLEIQVLSYV